MDTKEKEQLKKVITNDNIKQIAAELTKNQQCTETKPNGRQLHYSNYIWDIDEYLESPLNE
tara:strand:+ start:2006 stop:2188 length:183 start_codon:yes stop_codon:yes gene_type:complete